MFESGEDPRVEERVRQTGCVELSERLWRESRERKRIHLRKMRERKKETETEKAEEEAVAGQSFQLKAAKYFQSAK